MPKTIFLKVFYTFIIIGISLFSYSQTDTTLLTPSIHPASPTIVKEDPKPVNMTIKSFPDDDESMNVIRYPHQFKPKRLAASVSFEGALIAFSFKGLNDWWYDKFDRSKFHFANDGQEWMQLDKIGRAVTTTSISSYCYYSLRWSGVKHRKALFIGCAVGLGYTTTLEVLNGYRSGLGFSVPDLLANVAGTSFYLTQQLLWRQSYIKIKLSYHPTPLARYAPEELGKSAMGRFYKDYNGQTYWLSFGSSLFVKRKSTFPRWVCVSLGYGADGMLDAYSNPTHNKKGEALPSFDRYRRYFLSLDVDFTNIKTKSRLLRFFLWALNGLKLPLPTLEYNSKGQFKFHTLYF